MVVIIWCQDQQKTEQIGNVRLLGHVSPSLSCPSECEVSEESSGEAEIEQEASDLEDLRELHPGLLIYKAAQARNLPLMAEALAHGAEVNWVNDEDENKTPLVQAVMGVCCARGWEAVVGNARSWLQFGGR